METIKINQSSIESFNHDKQVVGITQEEIKTSDKMALDGALATLSEISRSILLMKMFGNYDPHRFECIESDLYDLINDFNVVAQRYFLAEGRKFVLRIVNTKEQLNK